MLMTKIREKIVIGVCTCRRPLLLGKCLESLAALPVNPNYHLDIIVIENDEVPLNEGIVVSARTRSPHALYYYHEPSIGIPFARNRAIDEALLLSASWIAFIDDDEIAESDWLNQLYDAALHFNADAIHGRVLYQYPLEDRWAHLLGHNDKSAVRLHGKALKSAATNNIIFSSRLVSAEGLGLRFDTTLRFSGGSDSDFFNRAFLKGAKFYYSGLAVVYEAIPLERCTLAYLFERNARTRASALYTDKKNLGPAHALRKHSRRFLQSLLQAAGYLLRSPLWLLLDQKKSRELYIRGVLKLANCYGSLLGLCGKLPTPYKQIQGY